MKCKSSQPTLTTKMGDLPPQGAQFVPVEIKALQQQRGLTEADLWRYIIVWRRTRDQGDEVWFHTQGIGRASCMCSKVTGCRVLHYNKR